MRETDLERIREGLARRAPGAFHLPEIYGSWNELFIGDKVRIGNEFQRMAARGDFAGVSDTGRKAGGGRVYLKGEKTP